MMLRLRFSIQPLAASVVAAALLAPVAARADCGEDLGNLMKKRVALNAALEKNKKAHAGKIDPIQACPQLRALTGAQGEVLAYMTKNKDWCNLPDDLIQKVEQAKANLSKFTVQACTVAVKMKQMQQQQATQAAQQQQQQALKLPAGPL